MEEVDTRNLSEATRIFVQTLTAESFKRLSHGSCHHFELVFHTDRVSDEKASVVDIVSQLDHSLGSEDGLDVVSVDSMLLQEGLHGFYKETRGAEGEASKPSSTGRYDELKPVFIRQKARAALEDCRATLLGFLMDDLQAYETEVFADGFAKFLRMTRAESKEEGGQKPEEGEDSKQAIDNINTQQGRDTELSKPKDSE